MIAFGCSLIGSRVLESSSNLSLTASIFFLRSLFSGFALSTDEERGERRIRSVWVIQFQMAQGMECMDGVGCRTGRQADTFLDFSLVFK